MTIDEMKAQLWQLQDLKYRDFHCRLMPNVPPERVIGIRTPQLRALARQFENSPDCAAFLAALPHDYYDENNLHGFIIERIKDFREALGAVDAFLPYVDNWATCDLMRPKAFKNHTRELLPEIRRWIASGETYTVRFGVEMLMTFYLDDEFLPEYLEMVAEIRSEEYYINMMTAWFFATALAKQYNAALPYIEQKRLDSWTHNKAIQKSVESYRITDEQKAFLKTLKIK